MRKKTIYASEVIQDFKRRGIAPDAEHEVANGHMKLWKLNETFLPELEINDRILTGINAYPNTFSPQEIAEDIAKRSQLGKKRLGLPIKEYNRALTTEAQSAAARENGKKGGRPRKFPKE